jgi:hypothetical protein
MWIIPITWEVLVQLDIGRLHFIPLLGEWLPSYYYVCSTYFQQCFWSLILSFVCSKRFWRPLMMHPESIMKKHLRRTGPVRESQRWWGLPPRPSINPSRVNSPSPQQLQTPSLVIPSWMGLVFFISLLLNFLSMIVELWLTSLLSITDH